jgi:hypothetical protein
LYRIVEVRIAVQEVLRSRGQGERERQLARCLGCRSHPLLCMVQMEQRLLRVAGEILDRTADQADSRGKTYRLRGALR